MLEVIILTRVRRGVNCRTCSIHAQLSGGARAALIFSEPWTTTLLCVR